MRPNRFSPVSADVNIFSPVSDVHVTGRNSPVLLWALPVATSMEVGLSPSVGQPDHRPKASFWIATPHAMDADMTCWASTWKAYYWTWTQDIPKSYLRVKRRVWCLPI